MLDAFGVESSAGTDEVREWEAEYLVGDDRCGCGVGDADFAEADGVGGTPLPLGGGGEKVSLRLGRRRKRDSLPV